MRDHGPALRGSAGNFERFMLRSCRKAAIEMRTAKCSGTEVEGLSGCARLLLELAPVVEVITGKEVRGNANL